MNVYDVAVVGGGPAGIGAAAAAARSGASVCLLEREEKLGGILHQCIHNGFGSIRYSMDLPGPAYAHRLLEEIQGLDITVETACHVLDLQPGCTLRTVSPQKGVEDLHARAVVLAMGCRERTRAQIRIPGTRPAGVYTAGMVQRMVNIEGWMPGRRFVILGSGDIGMIMARRLILEGAEVAAVLEQQPMLTGLRRNYVQCLEDYHIPLLLSTTVSRILGRDRVNGIESVKLDQDLQPIPGTGQTIACDSLLLSVGLIPENELSRSAGVELSLATGGPLVDEQGETSVPGIFAAGNVVGIYDLVDWVSAAGETAGRAAAACARSDSRHSGSTLHLQPGPDVASVIPSRISRFTLGGDPIPLYVRSRVHCETRTSICLTAPGLNLQFSVPYLRPAEMTVIRIRPDQLQQMTRVRNIEVTTGAVHGT